MSTGLWLLVARYWFLVTCLWVLVTGVWLPQLLIRAYLFRHNLHKVHSNSWRLEVRVWRQNMFYSFLNLRPPTLNLDRPKVLPSIVHRPSSIVYRLSSIVHRLSSIVHRLSSIVHRLTSACPVKFFGEKERSEFNRGLLPSEKPPPVHLSAARFPQPQPASLLLVHWIRHRHPIHCNQ